jgi:hypothetical protein
VLVCGQSVWVYELGCLCVWSDVCARLRLWCRVALCSLGSNEIGPEDAAAFRAVLASVGTLCSLDFSM